MMDVIVETSKFTVKARQLNDSLCELYRPEGLPTAQILFFHGFQRRYENAHLLAWMAGDDSCLWPQTWLVEKFPGAHILCVSYYGGKLQEILKQSGDVDMYLVVENLISDLLDAEIGCEPRCPVILVGHSFGGLVVKQLYVKAFSQLGDFSAEQDPRTIKLRNFVDNLKGVFFYGTPHRGIQDNSLPFVDPGTFEGVIAPEETWRYGPRFTTRGEDHISIARPNSVATSSFTAFEALLKDIVDDPRHRHPANFQLLPQSVVGITNVLENAKDKLKKTRSLCFVGMGGVGKTTLAMALFNEIAEYYQYTCFIREVKDLQGPQDTKMKIAMLERLHWGGRPWTAQTTDLSFLRGKRLLLVLDDVSSQRDLEMVSILGKLVHEDSRFIATSWDPRPFKSDFEVYSGLNLNSTSSRELFLSHEFPDDSILNETFEKFVNYVVQKCGGLPLTLTVLGKYLRGEEEQIWKETITALENAKKGCGLEEDLWSILKVSYNGLKSKEEKRMFLEASTVFYKKKLSVAMAAWNVVTEGVQQSTWKRLVELSLVWEVTEGPEATIGMHEQFLSLGRMMASDPTENSINCRILWNDSEKALELLSRDDEDMDDLKDIIALKCCRGELKRHNMSISSAQGTTCTPENRISISGRKLQKMKKLQYLWLEDIDIDEMQGSEPVSTLSVSFLEIQLPSPLVYVHLFSVNFSGFTFHRRKLYRMAVLEIVGCSGLHQLPETFELLQGLEHIELQDTSLQRVPDFGKLKLLKTLKMHWVQTAEFPSLPECLKEVIKEEDFRRPFHLKVQDGKFVRDSRYSRFRRIGYAPPGKYPASHFSSGIKAIVGEI